MAMSQILPKHTCIQIHSDTPPTNIHICTNPCAYTHTNTQLYNLYPPLFTHTYATAHINMFTFILTLKNTYTHIWYAYIIYISIYMYRYIHMYAYEYMHTHIGTHRLICVHTYMQHHNTYTHIHIYSYIYMTHMCG